MRHCIKFYFCTWSLCDLVPWDTCVFPTMLSWHSLTWRGRAPSLCPYAASTDTVGRMLWSLLDDDEWFTFLLALFCQHHSLYVYWSVWVCFCLFVCHHLFSTFFSGYWRLGLSCITPFLPPTPTLPWWRPSVLPQQHSAFSKGNSVNCMVFGNPVKSLSYWFASFLALGSDESFPAPCYLFLPIGFFCICFWIHEAKKQKQNRAKWKTINNNNNNKAHKGKKEILAVFLVFPWP